MKTMRNACQIIVDKREEMRQHGTGGCKMDLKEIGDSVLTGFIWLRVEISGGLL
jgi:hypothetical protein